MHTNVMLDIETFGRKAGCVVLSIGAVEFDEKTIGKEFEVNISVTDSVKNGLHTDPETVLWWMKQSDEARSAITSGKAELLHRATAEFAAAFVWPNKRVWCNGASFDFPILNALFAATQMDTPWKYWQEMDMRTIKNFVGKDVWKKLQGHDTLHTALGDARAQARTLQAVFAKRFNWTL